jgi:hypothetical protein
MKIASLTKKTARVAWIVALFGNAVIGFMIFVSLKIAPFTLDKPANWVVLFLPVIGAGLLAWAVRESVIWKIYGETFFISEENKIPRDELLNGRIQFNDSGRKGIGRKFNLTLLCQQTVGGATATTNKSVQTVWKSSHLIEVGPLEDIPITFARPSGSDSTRLASGGRGFDWLLKVREVAGGFTGFAGDYVVTVGEINHQVEDE